MIEVNPRYLRIALITMESEVQHNFTQLACEKKLNISAAEYNHLLSENFYLLIDDLNGMRSSK